MDSRSSTSDPMLNGNNATTLISSESSTDKFTTLAQEPTPRSLRRASNVNQPSKQLSLTRRVSLTLKRTFSGVKHLARSRSFNLPDGHPVPNPKHRPNSLPTPAVEHISYSNILEPLPASPIANDVSVPLLFQEGVPMTKVSNKRRKKVLLQINADLGHLVCLSKSHKIIPFETIKDIRSRSDARYYREQFQLSRDCEDRWLTLSFIVDGDYKIMHIIADTPELLLQFESIVRQLHEIRSSLMTGLGQASLRQALWERQYWTSSDQEKDEKLMFDEVKRMCKRLNISSSSEDLARIFKQADRHHRNYLDFEDFRYFVKLLKARPEVDRLYKQIRMSHHGVFNYNAFQTFMRECQSPDASDTQLHDLFTLYSSLPNGAKETKSDPESAVPVRTMSSEDFTSFLLSSDNPAFSDRHGQVWHDMGLPLSEYYVSSSHNTYLVGHQLVGDSTIEGYIRALLHSCRSVEIDIYDGPSTMAEPLIFHGKTLTSKVSLREVCEAIKKYGFVASPYPIIISAEVHCGFHGQDMIAEIMCQVFGDALVRAPLPDRPILECLPSPEDLKGKILLKTRNRLLSNQQSPSLELSDPFDPSTSSFSDSETAQDRPSRIVVSRRDSGTMKEQAKSIIQRVRSVRRASVDSPSSTPVSPTLDGVKAPPLTSRPSESEKPAMSLALAELLVYTVGVRCRGINKKEEYAPEHMFSLSEKAANKLVRTAMMDLIKHSRSHLVRIYPKGMRLSSTNYEPHNYWAAGAQVVALNWQTSDLGFVINHAMFQRNGRCGYVLKPEALRLKDKSLLLSRKKHILDLTIISAQQLPRPKDALGHEISDKFVLNPFVQVSLHVPDWQYIPSETSKSQATQGTLSSTKAMVYRTSVVKNNGFNPVWEERFRIPFEAIGDMLGLIFLQFTVRQEDNEDLEPLGIYCVSLGCLQKGYRHLPLHDSQLSQYLFSTLFVRYLLHDA